MIITVGKILLFGLAGYRKVISPLVPRACRFYPSCSVYAADAITKYGSVRGVLMTLSRISRCHPWNPGGYDPLR